MERVLGPRRARDERGAKRLGKSVKIIPLTRFRVSDTSSGLVVRSRDRPHSSLQPLSAE